MIKISIITPTYNSANFISSCICSVEEQSYRNYEHIIIDGCSEDKTLDIVKSFPSDNRFVVSEPDLGIYDAINKGLHIASGDIICVLHSDDTYFDDKVLEKVANIFSQHDVDFLYSDLLYISNTGTDSIIRKWISGIPSKFSFMTGWMAPHPTLFITRSTYQNVGDYSLNYSISSDYHFICRLFSNTSNFYYLNDFLYVMRVGGVSNSNLQQLFIKSKQDLFVIRSLGVSILPALFRLISKNVRKIVQFF